MLTVHRAPRRRVAVSALLTSLESSTALGLAHVAAGGGLPGAGWSITFGALVYAASVVVLRRRVGIRVMLPVLLAAQLLGHGWLMALAPGGPTDAYGHVHEAGPLLGLTPSMVAGHLLAAAITAGVWVLRRHAVVVLLRVSVPGHLPAPRLVRVFAERVADLVTALPFAVALPTRGPPVGHVVTA